MSDVNELSAAGGGLGVPSAATAVMGGADPVRQSTIAHGRKMPESGNESPPQPPKERLDRAVEQLNDYVQSVRRELHFSVDPASGRTVVKVLDPQTDQVIRQIPSAEVLSLAARIEQGEVPRLGILMLGEA